MRMRPEVILSAVTAAAVAACTSWAMQTRVTNTGGAYSVYANWAGGVPDAARDALAGIASACGGPYEIVSLELVPHPNDNNVFFIGLNGATGFGPFETMLGYECREPQNSAFNDRVRSLAATAGSPQAAARPENLMAACQMDSDCDPGLICYESRCRR